jgi:hypothetical protein
VSEQGRCDFPGCDQPAVHLLANDAPLTASEYAERRACRWHQGNAFPSEAELDLQAFTDFADFDSHTTPWASAAIRALVAEVRRLREALDVIAGEDGTYLQSLKMTDTEYTMRTIARDALGRK